ncbi:class I SAM-dependent methyltransferase [Desulfosporosinus lacus]|uniref:class I SAM-dependent methyltransferase n=1 Tax=Desulfosporosinus lacus TaxID=329936 RepID=UPI0009335127|nr:class I SAM-dependent methyltransferase [Desulfosporosinus lacus]
MIEITFCCTPATIVFGLAISFLSTLAKNTGAQITAVDMLPQFLEKLMKKAMENNLIDRITAKEMLMDNLTFAENSL